MMDWFYNIRERHIRRFVFLLLLFLFIRINWGYTLEGLYHLVLSARSSFFDTVDGELANDLGSTILSFGKTVSHILLMAFAWFLFSHILKWMDWDAEYRADVISELKKQNKELIDNLRATNPDLVILGQSIKEIISNTQIFANHQDRVVEFSIELEKLFLKTKKNRPIEKPENKPENDTIGLFEPIQKKTNTNGSSSIRRRKRPKPKF